MYDAKAGESEFDKTKKDFMKKVRHTPSDLKKSSKIYRDEDILEATSKCLLKHLEISLAGKKLIDGW